MDREHLSNDINICIYIILNMYSNLILLQFVRYDTINVEE